MRNLCLERRLQQEVYAGQRRYCPDYTRDLTIRAAAEEKKEDKKLKDKKGQKKIKRHTHSVKDESVISYPFRSMLFLLDLDLQKRA